LDAFPAFFPLHDRTIVVAGSGEGAEAKARLFAGSPARLVRLQGQAALEPQAYLGASLIFIADMDDAFIASALAVARTLGVPVNVTDRPEFCDFTTPSIVDRGQVVAAVGTGGAAPMLAAMLRQDIDQRLPAGVGHIARLSQDLKDEIRTRYPELSERRAFLRSILDGSVARSALAGDVEAARQQFLQALAEDFTTAGVLQRVSGQGPIEGLTLGACRALAMADVLVLGDSIDPDIVALARRDALRLSAVEVTSEALLDLVASRQRVVMILTGSVPAHLEGLAADILPVAVIP